MSSVAMQRDLIAIRKKETLLNVGIISKLHPMSSDLSRLLRENNLEKPTQNLFNHLAYYLVSIIDPNRTLPWPLYDTKAERTYRNELSLFITDYSNKGLLAPVMSSYLVNPGSYKVVYLMFQMSQLAVQSVLLAKMNKDSQKKLYTEMNEKYKTQKEVGFIETIEKETDFMLSKFSIYLGKKNAIEKVAKKLRDQITKMEGKLESYKAQEYIDNLVDGYLKTHTLHEEIEKEIEDIKNIQAPAKFFDKWLIEVDKQITEMETTWESKTSPFIDICRTTLHNTETLIARQTGEADKRTFMIEYSPKTDIICTDELEKQVNTQQKYILKNMIKDEKLNFPNLIRGFLISICFILKNAEISDEIYQFNEYINGGKKGYREVVNAMKVLVERVMNAEGKLQPLQDTFSSTISTKDISEIPPLPDLSDLKMNIEYHPQILYESFTPINYSKHQYNLCKKRTGSCMQPPKAFITPFHNIPKEDFFKGLISCRVSAYDNLNITQTTANLSAISQTRSNETIAECTSGFTKQQICSLISTKKSSSSKKFRHRTERPDIKMKRGRLFNDSNVSNESVVGVYRSHSSPNLYEDHSKRFHNSLRSRKLSIMKEDSPTLLEVSGIAALERDSNHSTPEGVVTLGSSRKLMDAASLPSILVRTTQSDLSGNSEVDLNKEVEFKAPQMLPIRRSKETTEDQPVLSQRKSKLPQPTNKKVLENQHVFPQIIHKEMKAQTTLPQRNCNELFEDQTMFSPRKTYEANKKQTVLLQRKSAEFGKDEKKAETPKTNPQIIKKTSSLEKIINRFKKVRESVLPSEPAEDKVKTIFEEKENCKVNDVFSANRNLLPDLLSPSCSSIITPKSTNNVLDEFFFDCDEDKPRKPRESLGTALGVDHTFLDQFDLID